MKHKINDTYPDETHYTIAVLSEDEEDKLQKFLEESDSELIVESSCKSEALEDIAGEGKIEDEEEDNQDFDEFDYTHR
jgi:hypothetical protein